MIPLLYFGRHVIYNSIQFSLDKVPSSVRETLASQQSLVLVGTTFLGVGLAHLLSTSVLRAPTKSTKKKKNYKPSSWQRLFSFGSRKDQTNETTQSDGGLTNNDDKDTNEGEADDDNIPMEVRMEPEDKLDEYPFLLSEEHRVMIQKKVLPTSLLGYKWKRLYSVARDGDSFSTCEANMVGRRHTLFVIQTTSSKVIGAYCDTEWKQSGPTAFEGGVGTCLYRFDKNDDPSSLFVDAYRWTGVNRLIAVCDRHKKRIGFGGGEGSFGLCVDSNFTKGSTASCPTFGNPPLCGPDEQSFEVVDMEVYGFLVV
eukprot:scaffold41364_cov229-Amphora_coffeaeformis.AAC.1